MGIDLTEPLSFEHRPFVSQPSTPPSQPGERIRGRVIRVDAKVVHVSIGGETRLCTLRGSLFDEKGRYFTKPVAVGDEVLISLDGERGVVEEVLPRRNRLSRRAAGGPGVEQVIVANVDDVLIVASVRRPPIRLTFIDRLLVSCEKGRLSATICLNKVDLAKPGQLDELEPALEEYVSLGYGVLCTSIVTGEGIEELRAFLQHQTTVLTGQSGVGKSSLLNEVQPGLQLKTGEISKWKGLERGSHTTTHVSLLPLEGGGYVVDTPGMRELALWDLEHDEVRNYFPEMVRYAQGCRFRVCTHTHEPDCAVKEALREGHISRRRFDSYLRILESLEDE